MTLRSLLLRLSLRRLPGAGREIDAGVGELLIGVQPGLGAGVIRYLWRNHVRAEAALVVPRAFGGAPAETRFLLVRAHEPAPRVVRNLRGVPGLTLYRPVAATVAVELGWEHPVELASCLSAFEAGALYLFCGSRGEVEVVVGPVEYAELGRLVEAGSPAAAAPVLHEGAARRPPESGIGVALTLAPTLAGPRRVIGALVPWEQAALLKKLLYLLPPAMLDGHQLATCDRGLILLASRTIDIVPLGTLLGERLPGLLIPVGMELVPRVTPEALAEALGHRAGLITVFPPQGGPFQVPDSAFKPLARVALARLGVPAAVDRADALAGSQSGAPTIVNDPVGGFALWGRPGRSGGSGPVGPGET